MPKFHFNYHSVAGDFQYQVMPKGLPMQRFWHKGKFIAWDKLISPMISGDIEYPVIEVGYGVGFLIEHLTPFDRLNQKDLFFPVSTFGEMLPFEDNYFGGPILSEVIEHWHDPKFILQEAYRVLRPGGWCFLTTPNYRSFWPVTGKILDISGLKSRMSDTQHVNSFNQKKLIDHLKSRQIEFDTSFYFFSLFLSIISEKSWICLLRKECKANIKWGMLLASLVRKPI